MPSASSPLSPTSDASALPLSDQDLPTLSDTDSMPSDWTPSSPSASHLRSSNSDSEEESFDLVSSCEGSAASSGGMRLSFPDPLAEARGEEERRREEEEDASYSFLLDAVPERKAAGTISEWVRATKEGERGTEKSVPRSEGLVDVDEVEAKVVETEGPPARTTTTITGTLRIAFIGGCKTSQTVLLDRFARVSLALSVVPLSSSPPARHPPPRPLLSSSSLHHPPRIRNDFLPPSPPRLRPRRLSLCLARLALLRTDCPPEVRRLARSAGDAASSGARDQEPRTRREDRQDREEREWCEDVEAAVP